MKQTAVEQLVQEINKLTGLNIAMDEPCVIQAKEMEKEQKIAFGKKCFYKGFEKAENDDANCFTAWREEATELLISKSE